MRFLCSHTINLATSTCWAHEPDAKDKFFPTREILYPFPCLTCAQVCDADAGVWGHVVRMCDEKLASNEAFLNQADRKHGDVSIVPEILAAQAVRRDLDTSIYKQPPRPTTRSLATGQSPSHSCPASISKRGATAAAAAAAATGTKANDHVIYRVPHRTRFGDSPTVRVPQSECCTTQVTHYTACGHRSMSHPSGMGCVRANAAPGADTTGEKKNPVEEGDHGARHVITTLVGYCARCDTAAVAGQRLQLGEDLQEQCGKRTMFWKAETGVIKETSYLCPHWKKFHAAPAAAPPAAESPANTTETVDADAEMGDTIVLDRGPKRPLRSGDLRGGKKRRLDRGPAARTEITVCREPAAEENIAQGTTAPTPLDEEEDGRGPRPAIVKLIRANADACSLCLREGAPEVEKRVRFCAGERQAEEVVPGEGAASDEA